MGQRFPLESDAVYTLFIGGVEVNDYFLTYEKVMDLAFEYFDEASWSKEDIEVFDCTNGYENATSVELDF